VWTAFYEGGGPTIKFVNNIFDANATPALDCGELQGGSAAPIDEAHQSLFDHNILFDSVGNFFGSNCADTSHLHGNLVADPQFVNAGSNDFHLKAGSPAIDAGNGSVLQNLKNLSNVTLSHDFDGNPREVDAAGKGTPTIDMGAYEFSGLSDGTPTRVVLSSSAYSGAAGPLTLTATLSSALGVPTGAVTFFSDGTQIGVTNAVNDVATLSNVPFAPGVHVLQATYAGQGLYPASTSVIVIIDLDKYAGTLKFTSSPNPSFVGQPVTFSVKVSEPDGAIPSQITLTFGSTTLATLQPDASGNATFTTSALPLGFDPIYANWPGDSTHAALSATVYQNVINGPPTNTALSCSPSSIPVAATANLTASVTSANGTPTGSISLTDNGTALASQSLLSGSANFTYTGLVAGTHTLTATYIPTGSFAASFASCTETVTALPTTSVLTVTPTSSTFGSPVTLTATVSPTTPPGPNTPTGTVSFYNNGVPLGPVILVNGVANLTLSTLPGGTDNLTCTYGGSSVYATSNCNTIPVTINAAASSLTLISSNNPAPALSQVLFTARLSSNGQSVGAGNAITLSLNGQNILLTTDATGSATYAISTLSPGSYPVTASFAATSSLLASSAALTEVITAVPTATNLTVTPNPAFTGQLVTMTATVSSQTSTQLANGTVSFFDGTVLLGTQPLNASGTAVFTTSTLTVGTHPVTATFTPASSSFVTSTSSPLNEVISASGFAIQLTPATITLASRATGTVAIQLTSLGNFTGPLSLSVGTLPAYTTASISPTTVTLAAGGTGSSTLTLNTVLRAASDLPAKPGSSHLPAVFTAILLLFVPCSLMRRRKLARVLGMALLLVAMQAIVGCTNAYYTAHFAEPGTYQVPVTAVDANQNSQTATLTVVVTP
jgi:hypothetical protein